MDQPITVKQFDRKTEVKFSRILHTLDFDQAIKDALKHCGLLIKWEYVEDFDFVAIYRIGKRLDKKQKTKMANFLYNAAGLEAPEMWTPKPYRKKILNKTGHQNEVITGFMGNLLFGGFTYLYA